MTADKPALWPLPGIPSYSTHIVPRCSTVRPLIQVRNLKFDETKLFETWDLRAGNHHRLVEGCCDCTTMMNVKWARESFNGLFLSWISLIADWAFWWSDLASILSGNLSWTVEYSWSIRIKPRTLFRGTPWRANNCIFYTVVDESQAKTWLLVFIRGVTN